jgi:hypothetical protein
MGGLTHAEKAMLEGHNYTFKPLIARGSIDLTHVTNFTIQVALVFMIELTLLSWYFRFKYELVSVAAAWIFGILSIIGPIISLSILLIIGCLPKDHKREARFAGFLYWGWWPFWYAVWSIAAVVLAVLFGEFLWRDLYRYHSLYELRHYKGVNPQKTPGKQMEDSGVVSFAAGVGLERAKGGCFVNGDTYCVAPIAMNNRVGDNVEHGTHDYFAVGINCCDCPSTSFRCGAWDNPYSNGGLRSVDVLSRAYFKLAVQEWSARTSIEAKNPLFFRWVENAEHEYKMLYAYPTNLYVLLLVGAPPIVCCVALLLSVCLQTLTENEYASKSGHPPEPENKTIRRWLKRFNKDLDQHLMDHHMRAPRARYDTI